MLQWWGKIGRSVLCVGAPDAVTYLRQMSHIENYFKKILLYDKMSSLP
jgi:hypothetical protein